jgi:indolepyruvate decarboxylase
MIHHTLGNGEFGLFRKTSEPAVCASAIMTPQNVAYETERLIAEALFHLRPAYMAFPGDLADQMVVSSARHIDQPISDPTSLQSASDAIVTALQGAHISCILPGVLAVRACLPDTLQSFVDACGVSFATMFMDKSVLDEQQPAYISMYDGKLMGDSVLAFVVM